MYNIPAEKRVNDCFQVEKVSSENQEAMIAFLRQHEHEHYSLFLLGNFEHYGPTLSDALYSGNYKMILLGSYMSHWVSNTWDILPCFLALISA